jgi:hypothetical protein
LRSWKGFVNAADNLALALENTKLCREFWKEVASSLT